MEITTFSEGGVTREHRDYLPFGTAHLAEYAHQQGGDLPLFISLHGERLEVHGFGYDPHEKAITLSAVGGHDLLFAAFGTPGDPKTKRFHHIEAGKLARHLEELAATIRATYPAP